LNAAVNHPTVLKLKGLSTEKESAPDESTVFKGMIVELDNSVLQILIGNKLH
jgi:hypothetical protein